MNKLLHRQQQARKQGLDYNASVSINYAIVPRGVVMQFSKLVDSLTMTPAEAQSMIDALNEGLQAHAQKMEAGNG